MIFPNYRLSKTWLNHSLESAFSESPSTVNVLMGAKHLWSLDESTFIIFFDYSERKWFAKYLTYWNLKVRVFVNTLTPNDKNPVRDCENLQFPIQMQLS